MKYLQTETIMGDNDSAEDAVPSTQKIELRLADSQQQLADLDDAAPLTDRLQLELDCGYALLELNRFDEASALARTLFPHALDAQLWQHAVEACDILFQSEQPDSIAALAHGIWLSVTFPIDPELTVAMLQHLIDETPDRSDGAAVAAAVANYIVDLRADEQSRENLLFFTNQLMGQVARRHSQVEEQEIFDFWVQQLELDQPEKFLPRLAKVLEVLVNDNWWYDRDALRALIPD
ncbi:hypothetical protein [Sedimenticola sp.]|uniref:hypothetical protein n=1 Tax=Sedimenticola sp. TaxID=1940285 RepID=UPI003D0DF448